jgi:RNA polymerase sigma factor (sigma-70 family)
MSKRTDGELVEQAQRGDTAAISELFSRYWRAARGAAFGVTGEIASAEDAAAAAFSEVVAGIRRLRDPDRFGPWLRTIVTRKARSSRAGRMQMPSDAALSERTDDREPLDVVLARLQLASIVHEAVASLSPPLRESMALIYFEGYDSDAAARFLGIPSGTLRRRLHQGRACVRLMLDRTSQGKPLDDRRHREIERLHTLIAQGKSYEAFRGSLALRPPPPELIESLLASRGEETANTVRSVAQGFLGASERLSDPDDPVGAAAAAIRAALPEFQEWSLDLSDAVDRLFSNERQRRILPPGFADGRPGAFVRATRALVRVDDANAQTASAQTMFEHLRDSRDEHAFATLRSTARLSDVLDLTWMAPDTLELRSVQALLENVLESVAPDAQVSFSSYDEPRYRSALQVRVTCYSTRVAVGGVLTRWPGFPDGVDAAHVRIFIEPLASVRSGQTVDFHGVPDRIA